MFHIHAINQPQVESIFKNSGSIKKKWIVRQATIYITFTWVFLGGSNGRKSACNTGDLGSIPGSGRSSGEGNGNPLQ